jgi:hypothetical protein
MSQQISIDVEREILSDEDPDTSYLDQAEFSERREAYERGAFEFVGVRAKATLNIAGTIQTIFSPGLWGIESDSDDAYFDEVYADERDVLRDILAEIGIDLPAL